MSRSDCQEETAELHHGLLSCDLVDQDMLLTRRIMLVGEINDDMAASVNIQLRYFSKNKLPVFIYISSPGGDMSSGYSIIDQMSLSRFPIYTIVQGQAISMAAIIAMYGTAGCRFMTPNSYMMIHSISITGDAEMIQRHKESVDYFHRDYKEKIKTLSTRTKLKFKELYRLCSNTCWMCPKDAIKNGMVDGIWTSKQESHVNLLRGHSVPA